MSLSRQLAPKPKPLTERLMVRAALVAVLLALIASLVALGDASPVGAACGTNWQSKKEPPETILVLRTGSGQVEQVGLKRYVAVVMASGEWPTTLPQAMLEAGALATKQYAWYYALEGNHRDGDHNGSGVCYDVRDDSRDQVYRPGSAEPTEKLKEARDALWDLSLRKNGEFFLTGYRRGSATRCKADTDGWHLYARSAKDCAKERGFDGLKILHAYYSPKLTEVWAQSEEPVDQGADDATPAPSATAGESPAPAPSIVPEDLVGPSGVIDSVSDWFGGLFDSSDT
jgi:hypothetical protein